MQKCSGRPALKAVWNRANPTDLIRKNAMNKKLIAVVLAALPVAAMADVTLYGSIRAGVTSYAGQNNDFKSTTGVEDFSSRIGFKGSEDLGNGLKAIWQVENGFRLDGTNSATGSGSGKFANRQSFIGLENAAFGKVRLGYLDDALTETEATDIWIGARQSGNIEFPLFEGIAGDDTLTNAIRYDSPDFMGFNFMAIHGFDEDKSDNGGKQQGVTGARLGYSNAGFFGGLAYQQKANTGASQDETDRVYRLEGGYNADNLYLAATAEQVKTFSGANETKVRDYALTASYTMGAFTPKATYSWSQDKKVNGDKVADTGAKQFAVGVDYAASKRTTLFAQYAQVKYDAPIASKVTSSTVTDDKERIYAVGVRHNF
ncbi:MAG: porin [Pseudogulbenkiania sp.]|nr:porin [Pseudogulbenkiania sp.]